MQESNIYLTSSHSNVKSFNNKQINVFFRLSSERISHYITKTSRDPIFYDCITFSDLCFSPEKVILYIFGAIQFRHAYLAAETKLSHVITSPFFALRLM